MQIPDIITFTENLYLSYGLPIIFLTSLIEITPFGWAIPGGSSEDKGWQLFHQPDPVKPGPVQDLGAPPGHGGRARLSQPGLLSHHLAR